jgi:hypothetical protein
MDVANEPPGSAAESSLGGLRDQTIAFARLPDGALVQLLSDALEFKFL